MLRSTRSHIAIPIQEFKHGPMNIIGTNKGYAFSREESKTNIDKWALQELVSIDPKCTNTYLKNYSRSYYLTDFHLKSIQGYNTSDPNSKLFDTETVLKCKSQILQELRTANIQAISLDPRTDLDKVTYVSSSSAGYGYQGKKGLFKDKTTRNNHYTAICRAKKLILNYHDAENKGECIEDAILNSTPHIGYTRTQLTNITEKLKVRNVWGAPFHHILSEGLSAQPVIEQFVQKQSFLHIGGNPLLTVPDKLKQLNSQYTWMYTYDWSQFDATCSRFEIRFAFDIIKNIVEFQTTEAEDAFDLMVELFIYKKVVGPDGNIYTSNKGVPSGSFWTNIVDSLINKFRISFLWIKLTGKVIEDLDTHGDDGVGGSMTYLSMTDFAVEASKYGWHLNDEKSVVTQDLSMVEFLGRATHGGLSRRSIEKCLRLLVLTEYTVPEPSISSFRANSIYDDVGRSSEKIMKVSKALKRKYGMANEEEVPKHFKKPTYT